VVLHVARKVLVVTPLDGLIVIAAAKQQYFNGQVYLSEPRQPNSLRHPRLFDHECGAGFERRDEASGNLKSFRQARLQANDLLVNRIDPNDAHQLRDQTLLTTLRLESWLWSEVEDDRFASLPQLASW